MFPSEYWLTIINNWQLFVAILLISLIAHVYIVRCLVLSVLDPLFLVIVADIFSWTIVVFMFSLDDIEPIYLYTFTLSQVALYCGLLVGKRWKKTSSFIDTSAKNRSIPIVTFCLSALIHVISNVIVWIYAGIPILRASRLGAFSGAGGLGIIERFANVSIGISFFAALYVLNFYSSRFIRGLIYIFFCWLLISVAFSGARSSLLVLGQCFFAFWFIYKRDPTLKISFWGGRTGILFLILSSGFAFLMIYFTNSDNSLLGTMDKFAFRLVSFGDVFVMAYPHNVIEQVKGSNPFIGMFGGFLSTFKLFPTEYLYQSMGFQFTNIIFGDLGYIAGPNPRHNIFGYHFFGWFGCIYSFALGFIITRMQSKFYFGKDKNFNSILLSFLLYFCLVGISSDFEYAMSTLAGTLIVYSFIYLSVKILISAGKPLSDHKHDF